MNDNDYDPLRPHFHEPNPKPPSNNADFDLETLNGHVIKISTRLLSSYTQAHVPNCFIVSTGHGTSGPFTFSGVRLLTLIQAHVSEEWRQVEVISGDGFGNRVLADELHYPDAAGPIILATAVDGKPLTRAQGLVRLIVPDEKDDALRQVKWVARIKIRP